MLLVIRSPFLSTVILVALVQSISTARGGPDSGMSGEMTNDSSDNRALNATAWAGIRWVNGCNGCKETHYCNQFFMTTSS